MATATRDTFPWDGVVFGTALGLAGIGLAMTDSGPLRHLWAW